MTGYDGLSPIQQRVIDAMGSGFLLRPGVFGVRSPYLDGGAKKIHVQRSTLYALERCGAIQYDKATDSYKIKIVLGKEG